MSTPGNCDDDTLELFLLQNLFCPLSTVRVFLYFPCFVPKIV